MGSSTPSAGHSRSTDTAARLRLIIDELSCQFINREEHLRMSMVALLAQQHMYWIGPPGTGKTSMAHALCDRITDAKFFSFAFDKSLSKEEIFGGYDLNLANTEGRWVRRVAGYLPGANIAIGDELDEGSVSVLNTLRGPLLDRCFRNGDAGITEMPLLSFIAASNADLDVARNNLGALQDRFLIHLVFTPVAGSDLALLLEPRPVGTTTISLTELGEDIEAAKAVKISAEIRAQLIELYTELTIGHEIPISNRRLVQSQRLLQAHAYLQSRSEVITADLAVLAHVFWLSHEHRDIVTMAALKVAGSQWALEALSLVKSLRDRFEAFVGTERDRVNLSLAAVGELQPIKSLLQAQDANDPVVKVLTVELDKVLLTALRATGYDEHAARGRLAR